MICDDCKHRDKCTKIISEGEKKYCRDKRIEDTLFHIDKDYLEIEQKKKLVETKIERALMDTNFELAKTLSKELEELIKLL